MNAAATLWCSAVLQSRRLSPLAKVVALSFVQLDGREGVDTARLARATGTTARSVDLRIRELEQRGWLHRGSEDALFLRIAGVKLPPAPFASRSRERLLLWCSLLELGFIRAPRPVASRRDLDEQIARALSRAGYQVSLTNRVARRREHGPWLALAVAAEELLRAHGPRSRGGDHGRPRVSREALAAWTELRELGLVEARELRNTADACAEIAIALRPFGWTISSDRWAIDADGRWFSLQVGVRRVADEARAARARASGELAAIFGTATRGQA